MSQASFYVDKNTTYVNEAAASTVLSHVWEMLHRDHLAVFAQPLQETGRTPIGGQIIVRYAKPEDDCPDWPEAFSWRFVSDDGAPSLHIIARDELGFIYGLLHYSRYALGVDPFWFWADLPPVRRDTAEIEASDYDAPRAKVRYRGWFVNDEVCLIGWKEAYPPTAEVWQPVFEALLRCGGNMVIPGTDLPKTGVHHELAIEMGLWVTHHHAEPLGAEMFLRAFPGKNASYQEHPELFEQLWQEAIEKQKDQQIVWVLSFRGQGDKPFWIDDPAFDTPEKRGALISSVMQKQYEMIRAVVSEPVCCTAMYGEIAELYQAGHIEVPADVIKIWADNGYGKMVSRRHGSTSLRVPSLPSPEDKGKNGIYYHVTFHDLQASNHLTLFPIEPEFIADEIKAAYTAGASDYVLVNSGNIRPHLYTLDLMATLWHDDDINVQDHLLAFVQRMYTAEHDAILQLHHRYWESTQQYGKHKDERAGDEIYHHPARELIGHWMQGKLDQTHDRLVWATGVLPFKEQFTWFKTFTESAIPGWMALSEQCQGLLCKLAPADRLRLQDHMLLHIELHLSGNRGLHALCQAYEAYRDELYPQAFVYASQALWHFKAGREVLRRSEHGQWNNFYRADWLTNIDNTMVHVEALRQYLRLQGDSPDMFLWYKEFLMPVTEKYIYLENTHREPLSDDELARRLANHFGL